MPAFNFQESFASAVEAEAKRQTIRAKRRHRPDVCSPFSSSNAKAETSEGSE